MPSARRDPIVIVPYDDRWPSAFEAQRSRVETTLAGRLVGPIEHIGSTAVPCLAAKPIIDMLARVDDADRVADVAPRLAGIGWVHAPEPGDEERRKWSFCFPEPVSRTHHLHIVEHASTGWPDWLAFRDHLRADAADRAGYARLKAGLAAADAVDRQRYRSAKAPFIERVLAEIAEANGCHEKFSRRVE